MAYHNEQADIISIIRHVAKVGIAVSGTEGRSCHVQGEGRWEIHS